MSIKHWWNDNDKKTEVYGENPTSLPLYPPQILHGDLWWAKFEKYRVFAKLFTVRVYVELYYNTGKT